MRIKSLLNIAAAAILFALAGMPLPAQSASAPTHCNDGTTSTAIGKGACSGHGGVNKSAPPSAAAAPAKPATAAAKPSAAATATPAAAGASAGPAPAGATAQCKDGSYSMAKNHQGACSSHGGVGKWLDGK
jgi:hypothetical protein